MSNPQKSVDLRARGGYSDTYSDVYKEDRLHIIPTKLRRGSKPTREDVVVVSSAFIMLDDLPTGDTAVWAAVAAVWNGRSLYEDSDALKTAIDSALQTAGYTLLS